jgi:hypothetical protein
VILHDPKLVREVLSNKFGHVKKNELPSRFMKLIGKGLASHEGEKWVVHRKIINHAFLLEKLKVKNELNYSDDDYQSKLKKRNSLSVKPLIYLCVCRKCCRRLLHARAS